MFELITGVISGAISGAIIALTGYAKSSTVEKFSMKKARQTVIVGAVIGGIAGFYGWTYAQAETWAANMGVIVILEHVKKAVWRRWKKLQKEG